MNDLKWRNGEAPQDYDDRTQRVYDELSWRIEEVRVSFQTASDAQGAAKPVAAKAKPAPKAKAAAAAKQN